MIIKTIKVRNLPEYEEILKKVAFNQAKDIVKGVWPELANNMSMYIPSSQEDTEERLSANQRPSEIISTGEEQARRSVEDVAQYLSENINQGTLNVLTQISNDNIRTVYREPAHIADTIMCSNEDNIRPRHPNRESAGAIYFNTNNHTLNIFDGESWYSMQAYRNDDIYIPYETDFRPHN